jgi:hypothetical protein
VRRHVCEIFFNSSFQLFSDELKSVVRNLHSSYFLDADDDYHHAARLMID